MRLWTAVASIFGAVALVGVASAGATPPDHWSDSGSYADSASCDGFTNFYSGTFAVSGKTMYDKSGNPIKDVIHQTVTELNWRSGTNDQYTVYGDFKIVYDYATDTTTLNGKIIKVTYPGLGVLFHDVGKIIHFPGGVTVFHGPHDVWVQGQDAYCNAFLAIANGK